ncbi:MAG: cadherin-like beta sandwich domain-containing protein [Chloroflexi bacterium]|nr:cadherin-like beta sandwich domain-containing protein [Chloroflexota bacterium]
MTPSNPAGSPGLVTSKTVARNRRSAALRAVAVLLALLVVPGVIHAQTSTAPEITSTGPFAVTEGETAVATLAADDSDTDDAELIWSKTGGADGDDFTLTSAGVLAFAAAKDYEDPDDADSDGVYEVTVQVSDGTDIDTADLAVTLANAIELTDITGPSEATFAENGGGRVATFSASSDADRHGVQWTISGNDADHFTIDSPPGALRFHIDPISPNIFPSPPDFEDPDDADSSNDYSITLLALVGSDISSPFSVTVTVTDVDEPGKLSLSDTGPSLGAALTVTLTDPDGVTPGTPAYEWERSTGRNSWVVIDGATLATYTPVPADTNAFLRVTATYDDGLGSDRSVRALTKEVVTGPLLTGLTAETATSRADSELRLTPAFAPEVLHYRIGCADGETLTVSATGASGARISVGGVQIGSGISTAIAVTGTSSTTVTVSDSDGSETAYVLHCFPADFPAFATTRESGASGVVEDLLLFTPSQFIAIMDPNGVPRFFEDLGENPGLYFRFQAINAGGVFRYSHGTFDRHQVVRDKNLEVLRTVAVVPPLTVTNGHDQRVLDGDKALLLSWQPRTRDLSHLTFNDENGDPWGSSVRVSDSAIQIVTTDGSAEFTWNSWGKVPLEDCTQHRFPEGYGHINSAQYVDETFVVSLRGCSAVLAIDPDLAESHKIAWRLGQTNLSAEDWASRDLGPAPLAIINDPEGEFCGQHAAQLQENGRLVMFDNGGHCVVNPWTDEVLGRESNFARAVEYALDPDSGEAVFLRDHTFGGQRERRAHSSGHVEVLDNGDWLVSWGAFNRHTTPYTTSEIFTQVDPATGVEKFRVIGTTEHGAERATVMQPSNLAPQPGALGASLPASDSTSVFHTGADDSPQVVVAFNRPVVDFDETSPSLSVSGATVDSVSAHVSAGEPANAYIVTLTPDGDGAITFSLLAGKACDDDGICTADGTTLSSVPAALVIGAPVTVSFGQAAYSVGEGGTRSVTAQLSSAHQGIRGVTIPVVLETGASASVDDLTIEESVDFAAGETSKTLTVEAHDDDLVEGDESATLEFGALPHGVTAGSTDAATVTVTDADTAQFSSTLAQSQVAEGGEVGLSFAITNGVTFEDDQTVELSLGGSATPGDDYTLVNEGNQTLTAPYELTFPAGAGSVSVTIRVADDSEIEHEAETITLNAALAATGAAIGATQTLTIPPSDVPDTPEVSIAAGRTVTEGEAAVFTLTRTASTSIPFSSPLTVLVTASERGSTLGAGPPTSARFGTGDAAIVVAVPTLDDAVVEPAGAVTLLILGSTSNPPVYLTRGVNSATVAVSDNDVAAFTLSAEAGEVIEGGAVEITIAADGVTFAEPQTLALTLAGTATPGEDFNLAAHGDALSDPYAVALPAGAASVAVTIETARDGEDDAGETIELTAAHNGALIGAVTITIAAPPPAPSGGGGGGGGGRTGPTPSQADFEWTVDRDLADLDPGNGNPTGMWSDGETLWLLDQSPGAGGAIYAYDLAGGKRVKDLELELSESNRAPRGAWSDSATLWVSDGGQHRLFAYDMVTGARLKERDIVLDDRNADVRGIWSDGDVMYVADGGQYSLIAYDLQTGGLLGDYALDEANRDPRGVWSDGVTIWVADHGAQQLFAYRLPAPAGAVVKLERVPGEDFEHLGSSGNEGARGVWSDGDVMYVADADDARVYSYNMPDAIDARLAWLSLAGVQIGEFDPQRTRYRGVAGPGVAEATIEADPAQAGARVVIHPPDADGAADGHQVALAGTREITVTVTSEDGSRSRVYRLNVGSIRLEIALGPPWTLLTWPGRSGIGVAEALAAGGLAGAELAVYRRDEASGEWLVFGPAGRALSGVARLEVLERGLAYWVAASAPLTWQVVVER